MKLGRTVRELLVTMDAVELQEWLAFYSYNPWDERADIAAGQICAVLANTNSTKGKFSAIDFVVDYGPRVESEPKSDEQLRDAALKLNCLMGGRVN